ncbi:MAG: LD-carboxypeptidase [Deltaproteobacteria bacterium]|nr:LD-carboxypeptidase [Deltaproteobacteria bacterium]
MLRPAALRPGDAVSIVAPSSPFDREAFARGLERIAARYRPVFEDSLFSGERYLAGSDALRLEELHRALARPDTRAVFCARGGYGAMRLLSGLRLPEVCKPLVGFSDVTALHGALQAAGRTSIHGPVITHLGTLDESTATGLFELLESPETRVVLQGRPVVPGIAEGLVVGGNLSVLTRLVGTPFLPPLDGAILFFEDVGERPYRLDRMWQHLSLSGALRRLAGIAMGAFEGCDEKDGGWTAEEILGELARAANLPCVIGLPVGHGKANRAFPLGARARLDAQSGTLCFLEGAVQ